MLSARFPKNSLALLFFSRVLSWRRPKGHRLTSTPGSPVR